MTSHATRMVCLLLLVGGAGCGDGPATPASGPPTGFQVTGDGQVRFPESTLLRTLTVQLVDADGALSTTSGVPVSWEVVDGNGHVTASSSSTSAVGEVRATWRLGPEEGRNRVRVVVGSFAAQEVSAQAIAVGPIAFVSNRRSGLAGDAFEGSPSDVFVMHEDGSGIVQVTGDATQVWDFVQEPAWAPDGESLAFTRFFRSILTGIFGIDAVTGTEWEILATQSLNGIAHRHPTWSADGREIAARFDPDGSLVRVPRANAMAASPVPGAFGDSPDWSPDGARIAYACPTDGGTAICASGIDGAGTVRLTTGEGNDNEPDWSPDGDRILFTRSDGGQAGVWVMEADGSGPRRVVQGDASSPHWAPDASRFVMALQREGIRNVFVVEIETGEMTALTHGEGDSWAPAWRW